MKMMGDRMVSITWYNYIPLFEGTEACLTGKKEINHLACLRLRLEIDDWDAIEKVSVQST